MTRFTGKVRDGKNKHNHQMKVPGRSQIDSDVEGWPESFFAGSLNVGIEGNGYPEGFSSPEDGGRGVCLLDDGVVPPDLVLEYNKIENNSLEPKRGKPGRGTGQFWRATVTVVLTGENYDAWLLRRINSGIKRQLEIIADCKLRDVIKLTNGSEVHVDLSADIDQENEKPNQSGERDDIMYANEKNEEIFQ